MSITQPPSPTLFPYTTLFRSARDDRVDRSRGRLRPTGDTAGAARGGRAARIQGGSIALSRRRLPVDPRVGSLIETAGFPSDRALSTPAEAPSSELLAPHCHRIVA